MKLIQWIIASLRKTTPGGGGSMPPSSSKQTSQRQDEPSGNGAVEEEERAELVVEVAEDQPAKPESKEGESMAEEVREPTAVAEPQEQAEQLQEKSPPEDGLFSTPNRESSEPEEPQEAEIASLFKYEEAEEDSSRGLVASLPEVSIEELLEQARELRTMLRRHGSEE